MAYKIAVASTDGTKINGHFGSIPSFLIYEVRSDGSYEILENRIIEDRINEAAPLCRGNGGNICGNSCKNQTSDHTNRKLESRIVIISDCRAILCLKIGADAVRQLDRKIISTFQVNLEIDAAIKKIMDYYAKIDNRKK